MESLEAIRGLSIPRHTSFGRTDFGTQGLQLHVFCDASERAYGSVAYLRDDVDDVSPIKLMCAKTRVTPLPKKEMTIARKELLGELLGSKLAQRVLNAINRSKITL